MSEELTALEKLSAIEEMSAYVLKLQENRDKWKTLAIRAYEEVFSIEQDYDDSAVWEDIENAYEGSDTVE